MRAAVDTKSNQGNNGNKGNKGHKGKVCVVRHGYYPADPRVRKEVSTLLNSGYGVDVICLRRKGEGNRELVDGAIVHRLPIAHRRGTFLRYAYEYISFFVLAFFQLTILQLRHRFRVVQVNNMPDFLVFAALVPKLMRVRIVLDVHDLMPDLYAAHHNCTLSSPMPRVLLVLERLSCRFADHVIAVTELWKDKLVSRSVKRDRCTVVMNVADEALFPRRSGKIWNYDGPNGSSLRLVYHGSLMRRYGVDLAVKAVNILKGDIPTCTLHILGEGEQLGELEELIRELGLEDVVFMSRKSLPPEAVWKHISQADVGIVPHRRDAFVDEILPNKLLEYVCVGAPVVTSRTKAIEMYFDGSMVKFFDSGDERDLARCILDLCRRPGAAKSLATRADLFNQDYCWERVAATYVALIDRLADTTPRLS